MSPERRSLISGLAVAALAAPLVAACGNGGFRPLHADLGNSPGGPVSEKLAKLEIAPIPGRVGQQIRNELIFDTTQSGQLPPEYRLEVAIRESLGSTLVLRSGDARGQIYSLTATFSLVRKADNSVMLNGTSYATAGLDQFESAFANERARRDAENRAAGTIATDLKARLASFLSTHA